MNINVSVLCVFWTCYRIGMADAEVNDGNFYTALWSRIEQNITNKNAFNKGCWQWEGCINNYGYGKIQVTFPATYGGEKVCINAHRASFVAYHHYFDLDLEVSHRCHQRLCVNPAHLSLEPHSTNQRRNSCRRSGICGRHGRFKSCIF